MRWLAQSPNHRIYGSLLRARGFFSTLLGTRHLGGSSTAQASQREGAADSWRRVIRGFARALRRVLAAGWNVLQASVPAFVIARLPSQLGFHIPLIGA